jgi:hypothetical protein
MSLERIDFIKEGEAYFGYKQMMITCCFAPTKSWVFACQDDQIRT